jgi:hypothetical protein
MTLYGEGTIGAYFAAANPYGAKYRIKLRYGIGYIAPSAVLYAIQSKSLPYVRRDGVMTKDDRPDGASSGKTLDQTYQLLFSTETVYLFLRRYVLLCSILDDLHDLCQKLGTRKNPASNYATPLTDSEKSFDFVLNYKGLLSALYKVLTKKADARAFESTGRMIVEKSVYLAASLPKLIERCSDCLVKASREDAILYIFDYCQLREVDPTVVRANCFAMASDVVYRVQYNNTSGEMTFSFLPKYADLLVSPAPEDANMEDDYANDDAMDEDEEDEGQMDDPSYGEGPPVKKTKMK